MEFILENTNIMDVLLPEKVKYVIENSKLDRKSEYDIEIQYDEEIIKSEEMFCYYINNVPKKGCMLYDKQYKSIRSNSDYKVYAGNVLSFIFDNVKVAILPIIKICDSQIEGISECSPDLVKIIIKETKNVKPEKGTRLCVCSIIASRKGFTNKLIEHAKKMNEREQYDARMEVLKKKNEARLSLQGKGEIHADKTKVTIDDIAIQLGVSKEKLQEFISKENDMKI